MRKELLAISLFGLALFGASVHGQVYVTSRPTSGAAGANTATATGTSGTLAVYTELAAAAWADTTGLTTAAWGGTPPTGRAGSRIRTAAVAGMGFSVQPVLPTAGGSYLVEVCIPYASANNSLDILVTVTAASGCTVSAVNAVAFQQQATGQLDMWRALCRVTCNAGVNQPKITITYSSGTIGSSARFSIDTVRFSEPASPSSILWAIAGNSAWNTAGNWTSSLLPGAPNVAQFGVNPTSATTGVGISMAVSSSGVPYQSVGAIEVTSARTANLIIGNSSSTASGTLNIFGVTVNSVANTVLRNNGASGVTMTIQNIQGAGTQTMPVSFNTPASAVIDATSPITISSIISTANNGITKIGAGTLTLGANNTFTGPISINNGILSIQGPQSFSGSTTINPGGQLTIFNDTATIGTGAGTLVLAGGSLYRASQATSQTHANPLSLTANSTVFGDTASSRSMIFSTGSISLTSGKTLTIRNTVTGGTFEFRLTGGGFNWTEPIIVGQASEGIGALAPRSDNTVADQTFSGLISGPGKIVRNVSSANPGGNTIINNAANSYGGGTEIRAGFIGLGADNPLGTGNITIGTDPNPLGLYADGAARNLGNNIVFEAAVATSTNLTIKGSQALTLSGSMTLNNTGASTFLTVNNSALTTISGVIGGTSGKNLIKLGAGTLKFAAATANTYPGPTLVNAGTLQLANTAGNSIASTSVTVNIGGTLQLLVNDKINNSAIVTVTDGGTFDINGKTDTIETVQSSSAEAGANVVTTASITLGAGSLLLNTSSSGGYNLVTGISGYYGNVIGTTGSKLQLVSTATGECRMLKNGNTFEQLVVNGGTFQAGHIVGQDGEDIFGAVPGTLKPDAIVLANGARIGASFGVTLVATRGITLNSGGGTFRTDAGSMTVSGPITGVGGIIKNTTGTLTLKGLNTYGGDTSISVGTLALNGSGSISTSPNIVVASGAVFDVSTVTGGSYSLASGQTLKGNGTVNGALVVASGATVAPGASIGALTFNNSPTLSGTALMEIDNSALPNADKLVVSGNPLAYGGTLTVNNIGPTLVGGETFDLFDATGFGGSFATINLPSLGAGLNWWLGMLGVDGTINVNRAPSANNKSYNREKGVSLKIAKADLLVGASDPDSGDSVSYDSLPGTGTEGTVTQDATYIYYEPNTDNSDTLQYRVKDTRGGFTDRNIAINVTTGTGQGQTIVVTGSSATVTFAGVPGVSYDIQRSTDLMTWTTLSTMTAPADGLFSYTDNFSDLGSPPPMAFYRLQR